MDERVGLWRKLSTKELMLLNCGVGEDSWESLGLQGDPTSPFWRRSALSVLWKEWCSSWNSSTLATSCEELTHWKRLWCWEGLGAGGEGDDRGWDGWMASLTRRIWVWVNSGSWWWTGRPGVLQFMGGLACCNSWGRKESDTNERLIWSDLKCLKTAKFSKSEFCSQHGSAGCLPQVSQGWNQRFGRAVFLSRGSWESIFFQAHSGCWLSSVSCGCRMRLHFLAGYQPGILLSF